MARSIGCNIVIIQLKEVKKKYRMDICRRNFEMIQNGAIIIDELFETIYYFPESFSNHEVQAHMRNNSCRIFPSVHKCICSLNQQKRNVVLADNKRVYATDKTDSLIRVLQDVSKKYGKIFDLEYSVVKNCLKEKQPSTNGVEDVISSKYTEIFQSTADYGNAKHEGRKTKTSMGKRIRILKPQKKMKEEFDNEKYITNIEITGALSTHPIFRTHDRNPAVLMAVVNSKIDPYSLCEANSSLGEIVSDCAGSDSVVVQPQPSYQTHTRNVAAHIATVSNNNSTRTRRMEESSNSESIPPSVHGADEQHGNRQNYMSNGEISGREHFANPSNSGGATGSTAVPVFTASDHIRSPQYQADTIRLSTFTRWPSNMTQKPEQVAQAGFYYTGLQDIVRCFACDGGLKNWDPADEPWIEHARWFPQCPFVQKIKGQEFVNLVRRMTEESDEEEDAVVHSTFQRNNPMANPPDLQQLSIGNDPDEPSQLDTDAAQIVIQTGYSRSAVAIAIDVLISKDKREYTAQDIMQVILEKEDRGELLPTDGDSKLPFISAQSFRSIPSANEDIGTILRENESMKSIVTCIKCKAQARNTLFLPCTHHCLCQDCAEKCSICPVCYKVIKRKIKTFMI